MANKWIETLMSGVYQVELPELTITGDLIGRLSGSGRLSWNSDSTLTIHATTGGTEILRDQFIVSDLEAGELFPERHDILVEGVTQDGSRMLSERTLLHGHNIHADSKYAVWQLNVPSVNFSEETWQRKSHIIHALLGPSMRNWPRSSKKSDDHPAFGGTKAEHDWLECATSLGRLVARRRSEKWFEMALISADEISDDQLPRNLRAIQEAFSFATGRDCIIRGYSAERGPKLTRCVFDPGHRTTDSFVHPPLANNFRSRQSFEPLIAQAVNLFSTAKGEEVARYLRLCRDTADNRPETMMAVTCICLEGLVKLSVESDVEFDSGVLPDDVARLRSWLKDNPYQLGERLVNRIQGLLSNINSKRPDDILHHWRSSNMLSVTRKDIKAWKDLRNPAAHASLSMSDDPSELQAQYDDYDSVLTLINRVALWLMSYEGPYKDYGTRGWPDREFLSPQRRISNPPEWAWTS